MLVELHHVIVELFVVITVIASLAKTVQQVRHVPNVTRMGLVHIVQSIIPLAD